MDFAAFLEKQESIYNKFRDTSKINAEGVKASVPNQGGYLIAFRHPEKITDALGEFSHQVSRITPAIVYNESNGHTTLSDYQLQEGFTPDNQTLDKLSRIVHANLRSMEKVKIDYNVWLVNQSSVIAAGLPNEAFLDAAKKIVGHASKNDVELRLPWGAHITTSRFSEAQKDVADLLAYVRTGKPLGTSSPEYIDVGHFTFSPQGFELHTHERFEL